MSMSFWYTPREVPRSSDACDASGITSAVIEDSLEALGRRVRDGGVIKEKSEVSQLEWKR